MESKFAAGVLRPLAYRPKDAAAMLGVSRSTIYEMISSGEIKAKKFGAATVVPHVELERVLAAAEDSEATKRAERRDPEAAPRKVRGAPEIRERSQGTP